MRAPNSPSRRCPDPCGCLLQSRKYRPHVGGLEYVNNELSFGRGKSWSVLLQMRRQLEFRDRGLP
jgi:hypothetical protein